MSYKLFSKQHKNETLQLSIFSMTCTNAAKRNTYLIIQKKNKTYIYINIYQKEIHEAGTAYLERFLCFSSQEIQKTCKGKEQ